MDTQTLTSLFLSCYVKFIPVIIIFCTTPYYCNYRSCACLAPAARGKYLR